MPVTATVRRVRAHCEMFLPCKNDARRFAGRLSERWPVFPREPLVDPLRASRGARVESMPKWVNQCKHGTEVTTDSPRRALSTRPLNTTARAESCVYACQLSSSYRCRCCCAPAGRLSALCEIIFHTLRENKPWRRTDIYVLHRCCLRDARFCKQRAWAKPLERFSLFRTGLKTKKKCN